MKTEFLSNSFAAGKSAGHHVVVLLRSGMIFSVTEEEILFKQQERQKSFKFRVFS